MILFREKRERKMEDAVHEKTIYVKNQTSQQLRHYHVTRGSYGVSYYGHQQ